MRRNFFNLKDSPGVIEFLSIHPLFLAAMILSCLFLAGLVALRLSGASERWEKILARALIVSIVPVICGMLSFAFSFVNPLVCTKVIWGFLFLTYLFNQAAGRSREARLLEQEHKWRCPRCKTINEAMFVRCANCDWEKKPPRTGRKKPA